MKTLKKTFKRICRVLGSHRVVEAAHVAYFGAVFLEAHGHYGSIAGGLLVLTVANFFNEEG